MNTDAVLSTVSKYAPCPHDNADTNLGNGEVWATCEDCGATFHQDRWGAARHAAKEFNDAIETIRNLVSSEAAPSWLNQWKAAIEDALVVRHILSEENEADARKALQDIISWENDVAADPQVSVQAAALVRAARREGAIAALDYIVSSGTITKTSQIYRQAMATILNEPV